ncbi:phage baseplate protein [Amnibacterium kyonggiense]
MAEPTRRVVLAGGAVALASAAAAAVAAAVLVPRAVRPAPSATADPTASPTPIPTTTPTPTTTPVAQAPPARFGEPVLLASLAPRTSGAVMQQVERVATGELFMTQSQSGSAAGLYTTVVTRCAATPDGSGLNRELDAMTVLDGGHGLGLHVEPRAGGHDVWMSLQGTAQQGDPDGGRLARFAYTPGVHAIDRIPGGVTWLPQFPDRFGQVQESIYTFDAARGVAAERMYDFRTGSDEQYTLRSVADLVGGVDRPLGRMTVAVDPPTMQGFAPVDGSLFRWVGVANGGSGAQVPGDPMALEQFDWATGDRIGVTPFPTLGQDASGTWRDGAYEPEGCSVLRDPDGGVALLLGVAVGTPGDHAWLAYRLPLL